ncbi:unnamed protein product [Cunninghamella blakesleeana]
MKLLIPLLGLFTSSVFGLKAVAVLKSENGTGHGVVTFTEEHFKGTTVHAELYGLTAGLHGFHIHEFGDLTNGCTSTGAHYNPRNVTHGGPTDKIRHVGDLGNIESNGPDEASTLDITSSYIHLSGHHSVIGRAILVHEGEDDLGKGDSPLSSTTGNAGGRFMCGVIGWADETTVTTN